MPARIHIEALLMLLLASTVHATTNQCEVTRFGLARETLHPIYAEHCVCATKLDEIKAHSVAEMKLAAACDVHHVSGRLAGAFYYVGNVKVTGVISRETDATSTEVIVDSDKLTFRILGGPRLGWPDVLDLSPGSERPEFGAPAPSLDTRCWRTSGSMDIGTVRVLVDVKNGLVDGETWNAFIPLFTSNIHTGVYVKCR